MQINEKLKYKSILQPKIGYCDIDFQYAWEFFGHRPNFIHVTHEVKDFYKIIEYLEIPDNAISTYTEDSITDTGKQQVIEQSFCVVNKNLLISFVEYEIDEIFYYTDIKIYYTPKLNDYVYEIMHIINEINNVSNDELNDVDNTNEDTNKDANTYILRYSKEGFLYSEPIQIKKPSFKLSKQESKLLKKIKNKDNSYHILYGNKNTGKTNFLKHLSKTNKSIIHIPINMIDNTLNNMDFIDFLTNAKDSVIVFDNCGKFFSNLHESSNIYTENLLQIIDSIFDMKCNIVLCMDNTKSEIDSNLMNDNNIKTINFNKIRNISKNKFL